MKVFVRTCFLLCYTLSFAQNDFHNDYTPVKCSGTIPAEFTSGLNEQIDEDYRVTSLSSDRKIKELQEEFLIKSALKITSIYYSGKLLYNDPFTNYLNDIAAKIEEYNPEIKGKYQIFIMKAGFPNAFATHEGKIFVTVSMLERVNSESELAFLLCHEISHILKKHSGIRWCVSTKTLIIFDFPTFAIVVFFTPFFEFEIRIKIVDCRFVPYHLFTL